MNKLKHHLVREMAEYVRDQKVTSFYDFCTYVRGNHLDDWFELLCDDDNVVTIMIEYIESRKRSKKQEN